jgi:hypothetical protein
VTATNGIAIPNKSTTAEKDIENSSGCNNGNHEKMLSEKMSSGYANLASDRSGRVGGKASTGLAEKRGAYDRMNKNFAEVANDSKRSAPRRWVRLPLLFHS